MKKCILALAIVASLMMPITVKASGYQDTYISEELQQLCITYGHKYSLSPQLLEALIETESSGKMSAVNDSCYGICQINGDVWGYDYDTPEKQIDKACQILLMHLEKVEDISYALDKYNGHSKAYEYFMQGTSSEYSQKVLLRTYEIERAQGV